MSEQFFSGNVGVNRPYSVSASGQAFTFLLLPAVMPSQLFVWQRNESDWESDMDEKTLIFLPCYFTVLAVLLVSQRVKLGDADTWINSWKEDLPTSIYKVLLVNAEPGPK